MSKSKVAPVVEEVLKIRQKARNSDRDLIACVWYKYGLRLTPEQYDKLMEIPSAETIRRIRQKLQEQGKYLADKDIRKAREDMSMVVEQNAPTASANTIDRILSNDTTGEKKADS